jgi:UDP-N-acetylmuramate--alanine ligase
MDADHLDIYGTSDAIEESFVEFANKVEDKSRLFITVRRCDCGEKIVYSAINVRIDNGVIFDVKPEF